MLTGKRMIAVAVYFLMGYLFTKMLQLAEGGVRYKNNKKKYSQTGKMMYAGVFLILMFFILIQTPHDGQLPYIKIFKRSTSYNVNLFSLNGLYSDKEMEPLFLLWCFFIRSITDNTYIFLALSYGMIFFSVLKFIAAFLKKKYTFTFMLFWPVLIDYIFGLRYALACAYCLLAVVCYKKKKYIPAVIFTVIGSFTHFLAFVFVMYIFYCAFIIKIYNKKTYTIKTLLLSAAGVAVFSEIAVGIYMSFRVSYRMLDTISIRNFFSYLPQVICTLIIFYYQKDKKFDRVSGPCILAAYFNMVMLPITIRWGIYRLPYMFLPFVAMALSNSLNERTYQNARIQLLMKGMIYAYCLLKIVTMGVQNASLDFMFII